ncbi:MAG: polysaccharide biosynthesis/export family protein [Thiohalomonadales bacterium]
MKILFQLAIILSLMLIFLSAQSVTKSEDYHLGPGDKIRVTVYGHEDLSGKFEIDGTGRLSLPLIPSVNATGLTELRLEQAIIKKLKPDYLVNPRVSVEILSYRPFYIIGEVKNPGSYSYVNGMAVVNAVAVAGGYTYRAKTSAVTVIREKDQNRKKMEVDQNTKIFPGDIIEVPERWF